eukprot:4661642-Pyramimonas_sp.AAC.1
MSETSHFESSSSILRQLESPDNQDGRTPAPRERCPAPRRAKERQAGGLEVYAEPPCRPRSSLPGRPSLPDCGTLEHLYTEFLRRVP